MRSLLIAIIVGSGLVSSPSAQTPATAAAEWRFYGGDPGSTKSSSLTQIDRSNVSRLQVVWRWTSPDNAIARAHPNVVPGSYEDTPLMANGRVYTITALGIIAAIDPGSGSTIWQHDPETWKLGRPANLGFVHRGLAYWSDGVTERLFAATHDAYLVALDATSGQLDAKFGVGGKTDLMEGVEYAERGRTYSVSSAPVIVGNVVITGASIHDGPTHKESPRGDVSGYDVRSGKRLWTFRAIPARGELGRESWQGDSADYTGHTNVWSLMSVDTQLGYVYLPFGTPTNDYYGGHRPGNNLFAESLVCLDARTGKRVWHFQAVHHGLWDYDFPAAPVLGDITRNGRRVSIVAQISKQGFLYVFDRRTGEPIWPIEERAVPQSSVRGEKTAPTQPFPTQPPPFERQGFTEADVIDFTPDIRARALELLKPFVMGPLFTPPTEQGTVQLPGNAGGANWNGAAFDAATGMLYVPSVTNPLLVKLDAPDATRSNFLLRRGPADLPTLDGLALVKPPYGRVTAYDLNAGTIVWQIAVGDGPRNHPMLNELKLPPLGGGRSFPLLTPSLLFVGHRGIARYKEPATLRALDKRTGEQIARIELPLGPSTPSTYLHQGRQYIVMSAGGGADAQILAVALPAPSTAQ